MVHFLYRLLHVLKSDLYPNPRLPSNALTPMPSFFYNFNVGRIFPSQLSKSELISFA